MSKFKVGDRIVGNKKANEKYGITIEGWEGVVIEVQEDGEIRVSARNDSEEIFTVHEDFFTEDNLATNIHAIMDNSEACETLIEEIYKQMNSDTEPWNKKGRRLLQAYAAEDVDGILEALTGWSLKSLLALAKIIPDEEGVVVE